MVDVDIVIIGGGFAGLSAAKFFSEKSVKCIIVEGRARLGGRTLSKEIPEKNYTIDLGGQWIGPLQKRVLSLIELFDLQLIEQTWHHSDPNHLGQAIGLEPLTEQDIEQINQISEEWDQMALELPDVANALSYEKCSKWDRISVEQFLEEHPLKLHRRVIKEFQLHILSLTACDCEKVSLLYWLILIRSIPLGLQSLNDGLDGAQHFKISSGSQSICVKLSENENILYNDPLKSVDYRIKDQIVLTLHSKKQIRCRRLLLAFSPSLLPTIEFHPPLPSNKTPPMKMGQCIKTIFIYSKAFWRLKNVVQCSNEGPCSNIFESNHPIALIGLVLGDRASFWSEKSEEELLRAITEQYQLLYETDEQPLETFVQYWPKEVLSGGCYAGVYPPSSSSQWLDRNEALIDGQIWLASTEMALEWIGYMEGAIEAGERFARHIFNSLSKIEEEEENFV